MAENGAGNAAFAGEALADEAENFDLSFLPKNLTAQCQSLIESYHELHGYACLPDFLWKAGLARFIETHQEFRRLLRKASTIRSAKKSNESFVLIATTILSIEILASSFAGWSATYPEAGTTARAIRLRKALSADMPLMEFYLHPPKYVSSTAIAALTPPDSPTQRLEPGAFRLEKYANAMDQPLAGGQPHIAMVGAPRLNPV